ncbi:MAG: shikimate dehydrogenase [Rhodospirillum sp.]|nr:shikimate dehydrogenase [Rhodospirillum sp.]MCF8491641.1 shikimate dehydrogenase [Rhodospirillum sp.]MCF8500118.1 shikimate dehydrogenase [Rhodospirillum sp.]
MISGKGRVAAILGWPVTHSLSPVVHGTWLARYGIDGAYVPLAVRPETAEQAFRALPALGLAGANVTVPHKITAMTCMDVLTERARRIGAVNTIICEPDGSLVGDNTDGYGFLQNVLQTHLDWDPAARTAVVMGAGGAARAICATLLDAGCPRLTLINRNQTRAEDLAEDLGGPITVTDWAGLPHALEGAGILVNSTSLGMVGQPPLEIDLGALSASTLVNDIVYAPLETDLLRAARERGCRVVDGLGMLLHQARPAFEAWFGLDPEVDEALRSRVLEARAARS